MRRLALLFLLAIPSLADDLTLAGQTKLSARGTTDAGGVRRLTYRRGAKEVAQGILLAPSAGIRAERARFADAEQAARAASEWQEAIEKKDPAERAEGPGTILQRRGEQLLLVSFPPGPVPAALDAALQSAWADPALPAPAATKVHMQALAAGKALVVAWDPRPAVISHEGKAKERSYVFNSQIIGNTASMVVGPPGEVGLLVAEAERLLGRPFFGSEGVAARMRSLFGG